jgi:hypothetical protein
MTPISIRYVVFFTGTRSDTAHTSHDSAKARIKNVTTGCFLKRSFHDAELSVTDEASATI